MCKEKAEVNLLQLVMQALKSFIFIPSMFFTRIQLHVLQRSFFQFNFTGEENQAITYCLSC